MMTLEEIKAKIEQYCDDNKLNHHIDKHEQYSEYTFTTYRQEDVINLRDLIEDKGVVKENYECIGTDDIKREMKIFLTNSFS